MRGEGSALASQSALVLGAAVDVVEDPAGAVAASRLDEGRAPRRPGSAAAERRRARSFEADHRAQGFDRLHYRRRPHDDLHARCGLAYSQESTGVWTCQILQLRTCPRSRTTASALRELLDRSHRLGADKRVTNFAGETPRPRSRSPIRSPASRHGARGQGIGRRPRHTRVAGVALLRLDRVLALEQVHAPVPTKMTSSPSTVRAHSATVAPVPSIDTPLHASSISTTSTTSTRTR